MRDLPFTTVTYRTNPNAVDFRFSFQDYEKARKRYAERAMVAVPDLDDEKENFLRYVYDDGSWRQMTLYRNISRRFLVAVRAAYEEAYGRELPLGVMSDATIGQFYRHFVFVDQLEDAYLERELLPPTRKHTMALHKAVRPVTSAHKRLQIAIEAIRVAYAQAQLEGGGYPSATSLGKVARSLVNNKSPQPVKPAALCAYGEVPEEGQAALWAYIRKLLDTRVDGTDMKDPTLAQRMVNDLAAIHKDFLCAQELYVAAVVSRDIVIGWIGMEYEVDDDGTTRDLGPVFVGAQGVTSASNATRVRLAKVINRHFQTLMGDALDLIPSGAVIEQVEDHVWARAQAAESAVGKCIDEVLEPV